MDLKDLDRIVTASSEEAFRLETLPQYLTEAEAAEFAAWRAGRPLTLQTPENSPWLARIARTTRTGYRWRRVHIVDLPLADYTRYELWGYQANEAAGEEIRIADRTTQPALAALHRDFWLIDRQTAVWMDYDPDGRLQGVRLADEAETEYCRKVRDLAWDQAEPLDDYLARTRPRLTA